jgi:hypothetical protein
MKWGRSVFLLAAVAMVAQADELHLRDGTVIAGAYVGGTQKEIYFQHTPAGSDMYPVFMVESVKFNPAPGILPGASLKNPRKKPQATSASLFAGTLAARIRWMFALFLPPSLAAQPAYPAH